VLRSFRAIATASGFVAERGFRPSHRLVVSRFRFGAAASLATVDALTMPAREFTMLLVLWIGDGVEEQFEAGNAADILGRGAPLAVM